jgi:hypothetical protein
VRRTAPAGFSGHATPKPGALVPRPVALGRPDGSLHASKNPCHTRGVEAVRIYTPRSSQLKLLLAATAFVAACYWIIGRSVYGDVIAVLGIGFFGLAGVYF